MASGVQPRPVFDTSCKPDAIPRLKNIAKLYEGNAYVGDACADAVNAISGERDTAKRRLQEINRLKGELREHKDLLRRVTQDSEWSCMPADLQTDIEAAIARPIVPGETP